MRPLARCAASAEALVSAMIASEVPTASVIGSPSRSTSAGTITKPPPTPKKPVSRPVRSPVAAARSCAWGRRFGSAVRPRRRCMAQAARSRSAAKASRMMWPPTTRLSALPPIAPAPPARPKASAVLIRTFPIRAWSAAPTSAAAPTTSSDSVVAAWMGWPRTYTRTGTARIEPPPPIRPRSTPIATPNGSASSSPAIVRWANRGLGARGSVVARLQQPAEFGELGLDAAADVLAEAQDALVDDPVVDVVAVLAAADDAGFGEQLQVFGDVLLRAVERPAELIHARLAGAELVEQTDPERLAEHAEATRDQLDKFLGKRVRQHWNKLYHCGVG